MDTIQRAQRAVRKTEGGKTTPDSVPAVDDEKLSQYGTTTHTLNSTKDRELEPTSSGRGRSAPRMLDQFVPHNDDEEDDPNADRNHTRKTRSFAVPKRRKKNKDKATGASEDDSYEPEPGNASINNNRKAATRSDKVQAKTDNESTATRRRKGTLHPEKASKTFYKSQAVDHRKDIEAQKAELKKKDEEIKQLRQEKVKLQKDLQAMDEEVMLPRSEGNIPRTDDSVVRGQLEDLEKALRDWSIEWAPREALSSKVSLQERSRLADLMLGRETGLLNAVTMSEEGFFELYNDKDGACLFLNTFVAHFVCARLLARPFLCLLGYGEATDKEDLHVMLAQVHTSLAEANEMRAGAWRTQTLKLLDQYITTLEGVVEQGSEGDLIARRDGLCQILTRIAVENEPVQAILRVHASDDEFKNCKEELFTILREAVDLFKSLWLQDVIILTWGKTKRELQCTFKNNHDLMRPHPVLRLRPDDTTLDGAKILGVVQPGIQAMDLGMEETRHFKKQWLKGVVYVRKKDQAMIPKLGSKVENADVAEKSVSEEQAGNASHILQGTNKSEDAPKAQDSTSQATPDDPVRDGRSKELAETKSVTSVSSPKAPMPKSKVPVQNTTVPAKRSSEGAEGTGLLEPKQLQAGEPHPKRTKTEMPATPSVAAGGAAPDTADVGEAPLAPRNKSEKDRRARKEVKKAKKAAAVAQESIRDRSRLLAGKDGMLQSRAEVRLAEADREKQANIAMTNSDEVQFVSTQPVRSPKKTIAEAFDGKKQ